MRSRLSARSHNSSQASGIWVCLAKSLTFLAISRKCSSLIAHRHVPASENAHRGGAELAKPNRRRSCVTFSGINDGRTTTHPAIRYPAIPGAGRRYCAAIFCSRCATEDTQPRFLVRGQGKSARHAKHGSGFRPGPLLNQFPRSTLPSAFGSGSETASTNHNIACVSQ